MLMQVRAQQTSKMIMREQDYYKWVPRACPIRIDDYIYYRRTENPAECLSLYRFPVKELPRWSEEERLSQEDEELGP